MSVFDSNIKSQVSNNQARIKMKLATKITNLIKSDYADLE